jgi:hypothetical protein
VVRIRACNGDRLLRTDYVSLRTFASRTTAGLRQPLWLHARHIACDVRFRFATADVPTGGLRPPLLAHCTVSGHRRNNAFCDAQTHVHKSGGRQPAVVVRPLLVASRVGREIANVRFRRATATGFCGLITFRPEHSPRGATAGLRQPLLVARANAVADVRFSRRRNWRCAVARKRRHATTGLLGSPAFVGECFLVVSFRGDCVIPSKAMRRFRGSAFGCVAYGRQCDMLWSNTTEFTGKNFRCCGGCWNVAARESNHGVVGRKGY